MSDTPAEHLTEEPQEERDERQATTMTTPGNDHKSTSPVATDEGVGPAHIQGVPKGEDSGA